LGTKYLEPSDFWRAISVAPTSIVAGNNKIFRKGKEKKKLKKNIWHKLLEK